MQVTYTNRKGRTYYLCRGSTKTGKPRYYFGVEPKGEPVEEVPEGYEIRENVNGLVSVARWRPPQILPEEVEAVKAQVRRRRKARNYPVEVKGKRIIVHEAIGPDTDELIRRLGAFGLRLTPPQSDEWESWRRFTPVLRFTLLDKETRAFGCERRCDLSSIGDWIRIGPEGPVGKLARRFVPMVGTDRLLDVRF